jgi:hypothetical protein
MRSNVNGLQSFAEDIWIANGPSVRFVFASLPTRMIVEEHFFSYSSTPTLFETFRLNVKLTAFRNSRELSR